MPPLPFPDGICTFGAPYCIFGYHKLNWFMWAGRYWTKGRFIVVKALAFEIRWLGMGAGDSDLIMPQ